MVLQEEQDFLRSVDLKNLKADPTFASKKNIFVAKVGCNYRVFLGIMKPVCALARQVCAARMAAQLTLTKPPI